MKWVIFDLDGTLSRTDIFIVPSIRAAMEDTGLGEWTTEEIRMTIGERTEETNLKLFGEERCARAMCTKTWKPCTMASRSCLTACIRRGTGQRSAPMRTVLILR